MVSKIGITYREVVSLFSTKHRWELGKKKHRNLLDQQIPVCVNGFYLFKSANFTLFGLVGYAAG